MALVGDLIASLTWTRLIVYPILFLVVAFALDFASQPRYPPEIPVLGHGKGVLAKLRNSFAYFTQHQRWIEEAYQKYDKKNIPYILQANMSRAPNLVIPQAQIPWMMDQPDHVLSSYAAHDHNLYTEYNYLGGFSLRSITRQLLGHGATAGSPLAYNHFAERLVHKFLARQSSSLIPAIEEEVRLSMALALRNVDSSSEEWTSFNLWETWLEIVQRITSRVMVGEPLCRDEEWLRGIVGFTDATVRNCFILNMIPQIVHPVVGRLLTISNWLAWRRTSRRVLPTIRQRQRDLERKEAGDPEYRDWTPPLDFITWAIKLAKNENDAFELDPVNISKRLLPVAFASIYTTVLTGHTWMLDMLSTTPDEDLLNTLRAELASKRPPQPTPPSSQPPNATATWDKTRLASLIRMDSSIRESQRLHPFSSTLIERQVVAPEGLRSPHHGWTMPQGTFVTVNLYGLHHDEDVFERAGTYDALRYSRQREAWEARSEEEKMADEREGARVRGLGFVSTSENHLAFGHGRHACPGRFFVDYELKLIMVHLLTHYDVKMLDHRPQATWLGGGVIPPIKANVEIRRREKAL